MSKSRPFPSVTGGCFCGKVRYRLETAPLFCYACHCRDCHKESGSAFGCFTSIEFDRITTISKTPPKVLSGVRKNGVARYTASCPDCGTRLWASGDWSPATVEVKTGTLDVPGLFEPDIHGYIEGKLPWVLLPEGARICRGSYNEKDVWPKSSLKRRDAAAKRFEEQQKKKEETMAAVKRAEGAGEDEEEKEADKTPTAQSPVETEDDEEFEKRYQETEKALLQRLESLTLKLEAQDKS